MASTMSQVAFSAPLGLASASLRTEAATASPACLLAPARRTLGARSVARRSDGKRTVRSRVVMMAAEETPSTEDASKALKETTAKIQAWWDKQDDKVAIVALGSTGLIAIWASSGLIGAIDRLPILPQFFELVGILFTSWFVYRYLLFKPDREELLKVIDEAKSKITGQ